MDTIPIELEALERVFGDPSAEPIKVSYGLLRSVTDNFSSEIARGGFGVVFLGYLGTEKIAVKKLSNAHCFSYKQFLDEIRCLIRAKHKNIVRFLGYCSDTQGEVAQFDGTYAVAEVQEKLLLFEYVPNGNIQHYLEEKPSRDDWHIRFKMINGICQGLRYLHEERIGHFDLKPENIMLDSHMEPKIADFGLSRFLDVGKSVIFSTNISGTMGYIAPESMTRGELSFMSDIYALGIIVIKLLIGPANIDFDHWHESLGEDFPQMKTCIDIARACAEIEKSKRPTICQIVDMLKNIGDTKSSTQQASSPLFPCTDAIDVGPLELVYPFAPNRPLSCSVALRNKTNGDVGYMITPYSTYRFENREAMRGILPPMSSRTVSAVLLEQAELVPLEDDRLYITMYIMKSNAEIRELIYECNGSFEELKMHVEEMGGTAYCATATTVLCERGPTRIPTTVQVCTSGVDSGVEYMEVHPTEPWVLLLKPSHHIIIWNLQTQEKIYENISYYSARFISRKNWLVTGDAAGNVHVHMCPSMEEVKRFKANDGCVTLLAVHPTRPFLFSYSDGHSFKMWDWDRNWCCIRELHTDSPVNQLIFNPNNSTREFATLGDYGSGVKVWELHYPVPRYTRDILEGTRIEFIFNDGNDDHLIAVISGRKVNIWDWLLSNIVHTLFSDDTELAAIVCHPTRPLLITASGEGYIHVWDTTTYRLKKEYVDFLHTCIYCIALIGSTRLVIAHGSNQISVLDIDLE